MIKLFGNSKKKETKLIHTFVGRNTAKLEEELVYYGVKQLLEQEKITENDIEKIREDIRNETYNITGVPFSDKNPNCIHVKMEFSNGLEFICFGKSAETKEIEREFSVSKYITDNSKGITVPPIYKSSDFIAFEFLDPREQSTITERMPNMAEKEKDEILEKIIDKISVYSNIPLNKKMTKLLKENDYVKEFKEWDFAKKLNYKHIAKTLNDNRLGIIENGLHPNNIVTGKDDSLLIIDFGKAMYGVPQTDLARAVLALGYEGTEKEEIAVERLFQKYGKRFIEKCSDSEDKEEAKNLCLKFEKAGSFEHFMEIYHLAKLHEYFKLAYKGEEIIREDKRLLSKPDLMSKYKLTIEEIKLGIDEAEKGKNRFIQNALNYAKLKNIKI